VPEAGDVRSGPWLGASALPMPLSGEERLARLAGEGNDRACGVLFERYHQPLYRYCRSLVRSDVDAQDALQSTFAAALGALQRGQRDAPLRPWLFRIAHNESISLLRRRRPEAELSEAAESGVPSAEHSAEDRARLASLVADLSDLPERQRGALVMRELSGLSHEQIAEAFGISVGAAKQTVFEARRSLAQFAEGRSMACEEIQRVISDGDGRVRRARRVRAHLRDCSRCAGFAAAISGREADLRALAPVLPVAAASGILARVISAGSGHSDTAGAGGLAAGATGKAATTVVSLKAVTASVAAVVVAGAGAAGLFHNLPASHARTSAGHENRGTAGQASRASGSSAASLAAARRRATNAALAVGVAASAAHRAAGGSSAAAKPARGAGATSASRGSVSRTGHGAGSGTAAAGHGNGKGGVAGNPGKHLGATKQRDASGHLGAGKHLGATKTSSAGTHAGTVRRSSSGSTHARQPVSTHQSSATHSSSSGSARGTSHSASGHTTSLGASPPSSPPASGSERSAPPGQSPTATPAPGQSANANGQPSASGPGPAK
jgi:RNA polymerase sigma factor (sigma-70 family)